MDTMHHTGGTEPPTRRPPPPKPAAAGCGYGTTAACMWWCPCPQPQKNQARAPRLSNSGCWLPDADAPCCHHQRSAQLFWPVCRAGESPGNAAFPPGRRGPLPPEIPRASAFRPVDPAAPLPPNSVSTQESGAARTLGAPRGERSRLPP